VHRITGNGAWIVAWSMRSVGDHVRTHGAASVVLGEAPLRAPGWPLDGFSGGQGGSGIVSERKTAQAQRYEARERVYVDVPLENFIGIGGRDFGMVKMCVATKMEEFRAVAAAQAFVERLTKSSPKAAEDPDILLDAKSIHILHTVVRDFNDPKSFPAFPSPQWMMEQMGRDEIAALLNAYNLMATQFSPLRYTLTDEDLEKVVDHEQGNGEVMACRRCTWLILRQGRFWRS
jgi:hypothetical protein